jgi:hypothetical protein
MAKVGLVWRAFRKGQQTAILTYFYTLMPGQSQGKNRRKGREVSSAFWSAAQGKSANCGGRIRLRRTRKRQRPERGDFDCTFFEKRGSPCQI